MLRSTDTDGILPLEREEEETAVTSGLLSVYLPTNSLPSTGTEVLMM